MSKVADYLQDHIAGDVYVSAPARSAFSSDASLFSTQPQLIVAPRNEQDIRKVARFIWQLAERGRILPLVSRGGGTDFGGAAIGQDISLSFTAHMNRVIEIDDKRNTVTLEPGVNFSNLQHMLSFSHGRYIPAFPSSYQYSTVGGAVANNAAGHRSHRFGPMSSSVLSLRVVLANGEIIDTRRYSKREVSKKMGQSTFEGEIYRAIDGLFYDKELAIKDLVIGSRTNAGYDIKSVREKDGSIDLTPLFVGSQGTLGIIQEITLSTESYSPKVSTFVIALKDLSLLGKVLDVLKTQKLLSCEFFDKSVLELARRSKADLLSEEVGEQLPASVLLLEIDSLSERAEKKLIGKLQKQINEPSVHIVSITRDEEKEVAERIRRLPQVLFGRRFDTKQLVPGIDDCSVPMTVLPQFLTEIQQLFTEQHIEVLVHGRALDGVVHAYPLLNLAEIGDRQKILKLAEKYYELVLRHAGSVSAEHGDGRLRSAFLNQQYGDVVYDIMKQVKQIFDPFHVLNPGVKFNVDPKTLGALVRKDYALTQTYQH